MYKTELIRQVATETRMSQRDVSDALNGVLRQIQRTLRQGQTVRLPGFGTFYTRQRPAGQVRHLRTGQPLKVAARRVAGFRVGEILKRAVRESSKDSGTPPKRRGLRKLLSR